MMIIDHFRKIIINHFRRIIINLERHWRCRLYILFVTSNHQATNLVVPKFFSVLAFKKENKLFIGPNLRKNLFRTNKKFVFFFNCSSWEKLVEKIGEYKIRCLVVGSHELVICQKSVYAFWFFFSVKNTRLGEQLVQVLVFDNLPFLNTKFVFKSLALFLSTQTQVNS